VNRRASQTIAVNRRARHDYDIEEVVEAGLVLTGTEIKSVRAGRVNLAQSFARIENGEAWLIGAHIAQWPGAARANHDPGRDRKLLLHREEIDRLAGRSRVRGLTLVPLRLYLNDRGRAKVELGVARGRRLHDKRRAIAERDARRSLERELAEGER
jgi:SsrA-binding protein